MRPAIHPAVIESALNGDDVAPESSVRRRRVSGVRRRPSLGEAVRELRIDASAKATLYVPASDQLARVLDQVVSSL